MTQIEQINADNMTERTIINAFEFSDSVVENECNNFNDTLNFLHTFSPKYQEEKAKLPFHFNVIDELHADENSHSRIFAQLLRYKKNGKFEYLESFLRNVAKFDLSVKNPKVERVDSCGRIDIPIFDADFVLVIENKVTDKAPDQNKKEGGQLARYIETIKNIYKRDINTIYVIYTPKYTREPSDECWVNKDNYSYKDEFKDRFRSLSYRDKIYLWIKNDIFPNLDNKDNYLKSALEQYIDYLEGDQMFNLREINKNMNMELQKFIKEKLGLQDNNPEGAITILSEKEMELNNALAQVQELKSVYKKQLILSCFENWESQLKKDFPNQDQQIVGDKFKLNKNVINIGIKFNIDGKDYSALLECNDCNKPNIYVGIGIGFASQQKHDESTKLKTILDNAELKSPDDWWYGWKYTSIENGYKHLLDLVT